MPAIALPVMIAPASPVAPTVPGAPSADGALPRQDDTFSRALADARENRETRENERGDGERGEGEPARDNAAPAKNGAAAKPGAKPAGKPAAGSGAARGAAASGDAGGNPGAIDAGAARTASGPELVLNGEPQDGEAAAAGEAPGNWLDWLRAAGQLAAADKPIANGPGGRAPLDGAARRGRELTGAAAAVAAGAAAAAGAAGGTGAPGAPHTAAAAASSAGRDALLQALHAELSAAASAEVVSEAAPGAGSSPGVSALPGLPALQAAAAAAQAASATPLPEARLAAHPQSAAFGPQLGEQMVVFVREGVQHARLQLNPAELGPVQVQIALEGSAATVQMVADHPLTRQALEEAMPALAGSLRDAGLTLAGGGVFEQQRQAASQGEGRGEGGGARDALDTRGTDADAAAADPAAAVTPVTHRRRGVIDLVA